MDLAVRIGSLTLPNPVMTASGTVGHGAELARYLDLARLGAVVVKSLTAEAWPGNPAPRVHETPAGMINSVGLQGPGIPAWLAYELPDLLGVGVRRVVCSIWGRTVEEYRAAAACLRHAPPEVIAVEVNLSCPNLDGGRHLFAHDVDASTAVLGAVRDGLGDHELPLWAKLSPNTDRLTEIAGAAARAGVEAVTLVNTLLGLVIDVETRRPRLGGGGGGVSGPAIHPIAVRAVYDCRRAHPDLTIIGAGGVASAVDAVELLLAGASAIQVGTATFADPRAPTTVLDGLAEWGRQRGIMRVDELTGGAHE